MHYSRAYLVHRQEDRYARVQPWPRAESVWRRPPDVPSSAAPRLPAAAATCLSGKRSKRKPMFVKSGEVVTCIIEIEQAVCIEPFEQCAQMGRFTLRDEGTTIGIGKVLELLPGP